MRAVLLKIVSFLKERALEEIFREKYYTDLEGGILEGLGRLFKKNVRFYALPRRASDGKIITADNFRVEPQLAHL